MSSRPHDYCGGASSLDSSFNDSDPSIGTLPLPADRSVSTCETGDRIDSLSDDSSLSGASSSLPSDARSGCDSLRSSSAESSSTTSSFSLPSLDFSDMSESSSESESSSPEFLEDFVLCGINPFLYPEEFYNFWRNHGFFSNVNVEAVGTPLFDEF